MIKRKREEEKAKRAVPFTAPKDAATKAIVAQNASCSPLLRMPLKISHKIWALVVGHRLIHMKYDERRQSWGHIICEHDCPESEMGKISSVTAEDGERRIICQGRHHRCDDELANYKHSGHKSLHLTPLRVCRQNYHEANYILWTTNMFSFNDAVVSFDRFMKARTTPQKRLLRRLRLVMDWFPGNDKAWNRVLDWTEEPTPACQSFYVR